MESDRPCLLKSVYCFQFLFILAFMLGVVTSLGEIIPRDRIVLWDPGVEGGFPNYPNALNVKNSPYNAVGNGLSDDTAAINGAIADCRSGQAVFVPQGTYRIDGTLIIRAKSVILRGAGPEKTRLLSYGSKRALIIVGDVAWDWDSKAVTSAVNADIRKGSVTISVANGSLFQVSDHVLVDELNDPAFVNKTGLNGDCNFCSRDAGNRGLGQMNKVVAKQGNIITLETPLYWSMSNSPEVATMDPSQRPYTVYAGVEDLYVEDATDGCSRGTIEMARAANCWVDNIESYQANASHIALEYCYKSEIRHSYFHHQWQYVSQSYGIWLRRQSSECLVEDNILYHLRAPVVFEGCSGNVIAYNYLHYGWFPSNTRMPYALETHGVHSFMNLIEGNKANGFFGDRIHGSASHFTLFRNYFFLNEDRADEFDRSIYAVKLDEDNRFMNVVGNVLGYRDSLMHYEIENVDCPGGNEAKAALYKLGYNFQSDCSASGNDPSVKATLLRHMNYDYFNNDTLREAAISDIELPGSFYLSSRPKFFGTLAWPPIGPDRNPMIGIIPAEARFHGSIPDDLAPSGVEMPQQFKRTVPQPKHQKGP